MKCCSYNIFFETIGTRIRMRIVGLLQKAPMSVNYICSALGEEQSKVSHNLKALAECHFLDVERRGRTRVYSLNKTTIVPLMKLVERHVKKYCCRGCDRK